MTTSLFALFAVSFLPALGDEQLSESIADLLHRADVQGEVNLTRSQLDKWLKLDPPPKAKVHSSFAPDSLELADPDVQAKREQEREKRVWSLLSPSQVSRLMELYIQRSGPACLARNDVQAVLEFSAPQCDEVRRATSEYRFLVNSIIKLQTEKRSEFDRPDPKKLNDRLKLAKSKLRESLDRAMNPDQRDKLKQLGGKEFSFATWPGK
ncbi:MAG: hypothetical protein JNM34_00560 [Chthonomonadaceae bacterium]|nr:hypothetical protein [Chthonomonadaceae bacterium]